MSRRDQDTDRKQHWPHILGHVGAALVLLLTVGCATQASDGRLGMSSSPAMDRAAVMQVTADWHEASREAISQMMQKYGPPAELTPTMAVWHRTGPWKRTVISAEAVQHNFPMPHPDVMEQVIDYQVPLELYSELAMYDGSVIVERTKGEMSARCDKEGANFLALNLAHEIVMGELDVEEARQRYAEEIRAVMAGQPTEYTQGLIFTPPARAHDPDRAIMNTPGG